MPWEVPKYLCLRLNHPSLRPVAKRRRKQRRRRGTLVSDATREYVQHPSPCGTEQTSGTYNLLKSASWSGVELVMMKESALAIIRYQWLPRRDVARVVLRRLFTALSLCVQSRSVQSRSGYKSSQRQFLHCFLPPDSLLL